MSLLKTNEIQNYNGSSLTLTASTVSTSAQLNTGGNISVTGSINVSDDSTTRSNLGLGTMATQNANAVAITGGTINTVQPATGQSLTIKDEDGNTAIIIGTDNTAAGYLSLNFGSYHGGSGTQTGNTLSDYETGTFTPSLSAPGATFTYAYQTAGRYTKIGNTVALHARIGLSSATGGSGNVEVTGLPFTAAPFVSGNNVGQQGIVGRAANFAGDVPMSIEVQASTTSASLYYRTASNVRNTTLAYADLGNSADFLFTVTYQTS